MPREWRDRVADVILARLVVRGFGDGQPHQILERKMYLCADPDFLRRRVLLAD
jgi:hypothetical protein